MAYTGSKAFFPKGTQLQYDASLGVGGSRTWTTVSETKKASRTGGKADTVDVTNFDSTGAYKEWLPTLLEGGDVDFDCNFLPADVTQLQLQTYFDNQTLVPWQIQFPNNLGLLNFNAYCVTPVNFAAELTKEAMFTFKLKITGKPVFTPNA